MKYGRFEQQGRTFFGSVEGDTVNEIDGSIIENANAKPNGKRHALSDRRILAPCVPPNFYCAGLNYQAHLDWANSRKGTNAKDIGVLRNPIVKASA